jgi:hypothetical protein
MQYIASFKANNASQITVIALLHIYSAIIQTLSEMGLGDSNPP